MKMYLEAVWKPTLGRVEQAVEPVSVICMLRQGFRLATLKGQREGRVVRHSRESGNPAGIV